MTASLSASSRGSRPSLLPALALNALPVIGVVFWGWSAFALLMLYWAENVIEGVGHIFKMAAAAARRREAWSMIFFVPFFTLHFGLFCVAHAFFIILISGVAHDDPSVISSRLNQMLQDHTGALFVLGAVAVMQIVSVARFGASAEAVRVRPVDMMAAPYQRVLILHATIIIGGALVMDLGQPVMAVAALALLKSAIDVGLTLSRRAPALAG